MLRSVSLINLPTEVLSLTGAAVRAAGWYGMNDGMHTFAVQTRNFRGRLAVQASLATDPQPGDWCSILPQAQAYLEYAAQTTSPYGGDTSTIGFTFFGNVTWVRAIVDRAYLMAVTPLQVGGFGTVSVLMNF